MQRNSSSLSTESSEFEFDSCSFPEVTDDPPLSPKLLSSPNYSPNYSHNVESALTASTNQFSAAKDFHASKAEYYLQQQDFDDHLPASFTLTYAAPPSAVLRINNESATNASEVKKRVNLRSLLNRRDLEQLPPLTNYNIKSNHQINNKNVKKQLVPVKRSSPASASSSSASSSSSPNTYRATHYTNPCKYEDNHSDYAGDDPASERKSCQKKSRKWANFKLDFLRKGPSPRADPAHNQTSNDKQVDFSLNGGIISSQPDHCSIAAAAAEENKFDDYLHERDADAAAAAAEEARFNQSNINSNYCAAAAEEAAREARFNVHQINQRFDNYRVITKFESPRKSTCSVISSVSSSPRHADNEVIRANRKKISKSAPVSPAGSPTRSLQAGESAFTRGRAPMSPHALHYQQQRARTEEHRRKTFLPYRQSLLSACFFPSPPHQNPQQAVY